ncbi:unnamed protein product [Merluccius merluccius]
MEDQVREATALGISACQLDSDNEELLKRGSFNIVFGSPESWLSGKWRDMLANEVYKDNLLGIVVDEVHLTYKWNSCDGIDCICRSAVKGHCDETASHD